MAFTVLHKRTFAKTWTHGGEDYGSFEAANEQACQLFKDYTETEVVELDPLGMYVNDELAVAVLLTGSGYAVA